jgi:hypothetical protein
MEWISPHPFHPLPLEKTIAGEGKEFGAKATLAD